MICAGGDNDGEIIGLAQGSVEDNVLVHILWCVIVDKAHESDLVVDDEQSGVVPINTLELVCGN